MYLILLGRRGTGKFTFGWNLLLLLLTEVIKSLVLCPDTEGGSVFSDSEDEQADQRNKANLGKKGKNSKAYSRAG